MARAVREVDMKDRKRAKDLMLMWDLVKCDWV